MTVVAGQATDITDTLLPIGSISGRIVEDGAPVEGASVHWSGPNGFPAAFTATDADGRYRVPRLFASTDQVLVSLQDGRMQWAHGKLTQADADELRVSAGAETVVDEAILPTGRLRVRGRRPDWRADQRLLYSGRTGHRRMHGRRGRHDRQGTPTAT